RPPHTSAPPGVVWERVPLPARRPADASYNADVARRLLAGETGPVRDAVLLNSAAALVALEPGPGPLAEQIRAGMDRAAESIDTGAAPRAPGRGGAAPPPDPPPPPPPGT
ncbi:hypothetical protein ACFXA8_29880, partial [Streptomyces sp. NPDC059409]